MPDRQTELAQIEAFIAKRGVKLCPVAAAYATTGTIPESAQLIHRERNAAREANKKESAWQRHVRMAQVSGIAAIRSKARTGI